MHFYFHNIRAPFATTRSFLIQIHLSFVWYFSPFMSIFTKKVFSVMCHIGGIPTRRNDFFPKNRSRQKLHRFHFSIFFKIPKGGEAFGTNDFFGKNRFIACGFPQYGTSPKKLFVKMLINVLRYIT